MHTTILFSNGHLFKIKIGHLAISFNKDKPPATRITVVLRGTDKFHGEGKKYFIKADNLSNLCVFHT
jgi:hypothetical protein